MRLWRGTASKALLMSSATRSVLCGGLVELMPSNILCVRSVRSVFVECSGPKSCCIADRGMCDVSFKMRHSVILSHWE